MNKNDAFDAMVLAVIRQISVEPEVIVNERTWRVATGRADSCVYVCVLDVLCQEDQSASGLVDLISVMMAFRRLKDRGVLAPVEGSRGAYWVMMD